MVDRHIGDDERRRRIVDRHLVGRTDRSTRSVIDVVRALGLLHSTDPSTPYLSIVARSDASWADIDELLYERRRLLRHTTIRRTVFTMSNDIAPFAHGAYNGALVTRLRSNLTGWLDAEDSVASAEQVLVTAESAVVNRLLDVGPATGATLANEISELRTTVDPNPGRSDSTPIRITSKVLEVLVAAGRIARGRPTGRTFTSGAWTWEAIDGWFPDGIPEIDPADALAELIRTFLASSGPATVTDMAWWTGLAKGRVRAALVALGAESASLDAGTEVGFVLAGDSEITSSSDGASVALLPGLDSTIMGWKQRGWFVDDSPSAGIFDRNGNAGPTIWVDGRVVGVWTQRSDGRIVTELPDRPDPTVARAIDHECDRLAALLGDVRVNWRYPTPITRRLEA